MSNLSVIIKDSNVNEETALAINSKFESFFIETEKWKEKAYELVVTDISQTDKMQDALIARKSVTAIRQQIESTRKELKEDSLRKGQLIDKIAKTLKDQIEPIEEHLKEQEQFRLRYEAAQREKLKKERETKLLPFGVDVSYIDLANMPADKFDTLLENSISIYNEKLRKEKEDEENRINAIKAEKQKQKEIEAENERLRKEAKERAEAMELERKANEKAMDEQRQRAEAERQRAEAERQRAEAERQRAEAERKRIEAEQQKERAIQEAKLKEERDAKEKAERELRLKKEAEQKAEREAKAAEKKARLAPDKEKLLKLAETIQNIELPVLKNEESETIINNIRSLLGKVVTYTKSQAEIL